MDMTRNGTGHHRLLILSQNSSDYADLIRQAQLPDLTMQTFDNADAALPHAGDVDIFFGDPDLLREVLPAMDRLQWAQSTWAGVNPLMENGDKTDYLLTSVKDIFGPMMAEYVICHMLMHERGALKRYSSQQKGEWDTSRPGRLPGKKLGIMGVGSIGTAIAQAGKFFGMETCGYSRTPSPRPHIDRMFGEDQLLEFVRELDYLVSVLPHTAATTHLLDADLFHAMKFEAVLINVGRGNVVDETALVDALEQNEIAGAVLDVFQQEPLPKSHPFWNTPGLIITSHTAALSFPEDIAPLFIENYRRFAAGKPLKFLVDFGKGY